MSGESGNSTSEPNVHREVITSQSTPYETTIETVTVETVEHETETKPGINEASTYNNKESQSEQNIVIEKPILIQDVKEKVIEAPKVVQTTETLTTHTNDNSQSSDSSKKDNPEISEKSNDEIGEASSHVPKIQFTEQEKPDHSKSEANSTTVESATKTTPTKEETKASEATKKHVDMVNIIFGLRIN